jgi:cellulose synthase/poly-beta-1,6-N-acetylglucosamine synthase-like glycosyltransferase
VTATVVLLALAALWLALTLHDLHSTTALPELPALPPRGAGGPRPAVTVVVAVRDDVAHVDACVASLLAQRGVDLRLIAADDRSTDGTGEALDALAAADARLTVVHVRELPVGWLGKSHALHVAAAHVATPWLLFSDGDARLAPDALAQAIAAAEGSGAGHVALLPDHRGATLAGRACLLAFHLTVLRRVVAANAEPQRSFVGTGAFNLVRTAAYRAIGGHEPLRLEVVDDVWLGALLHRAGFRTRVWLAPRALDVEWGGTPRDLVRVTTKNMFAVLRYRTALAMLLVVSAGGAIAVSLAAPLLGGAIGWLPFAAYWSCAVPGVRFARRLRWPVLAGLLVPLGRIALPVALARSVATTLWQRGVQWRGTAYPLAQLRAGQVGGR